MSLTYLASLSAASVLFAASPVGSTAQAAPEETAPIAAWTRVDLPGSFLTAHLPEPRRNESGTRDTALGEVRHTTIAATIEGAELSVTRTRVPAAAGALATDEMLLRRTRDALLESLSAKESGWSDFEKDAYEGARLRYQGNGRRGRAEIYAKGKTIVVFNAMWEGEEAPKAVRRFFASVQ